MSTFDLKKATIRVTDGYANTTKLGAINNVAGYPIGTTVITVDGFTGSVATGGLFIIGKNRALITAHTETTSNTTSITIAAPGLTEAVVDNAVVTTTAKYNFLEIKLGDGTVKFDETRNIEYMLNRGIIDEVRLGDETPLAVDFDFRWTNMKGVTGAPTFTDAVKQIGDCATWVSADSDLCRPYAVNIEIIYEPGCAGGNENITLPNFRYEKLSYDAKSAKVSCSGKCNIVAPVAQRL